MSIFGEARREMALFDGKVSAKTAKQLEEVGSDLLDALEALTIRLPRLFCDVANVQEKKMRERAVKNARAAIAKARGEA
jgi:hypothetical protein